MYPSLLVFLGLFCLFHSPSFAEDQVASLNRQYEALVAEGNSLLKSGQFQGAASKAHQAIGINSRRFEAYTVAAIAAQRLGKNADAQAMLQQALIYVPTEKRAKLEELRKLISSEKTSESGSLSASPGSGQLEAARTNNSDALREKLQLIKNTLTKMGEISSTESISTGNEVADEVSPELGATLREPSFFDLTFRVDIEVGNSSHTLFQQHHQTSRFRSRRGKVGEVTKTDYPRFEIELNSLDAQKVRVMTAAAAVLSEEGAFGLLRFGEGAVVTFSPELYILKVPNRRAGSGNVEIFFTDKKLATDVAKAFIEAIILAQSSSPRPSLGSSTFPSSSGTLSHDNQNESISRGKDVETSTHESFRGSARTSSVIHFLEDSSLFYTFLHEGGTKPGAVSPFLLSKGLLKVTGEQHAYLATTREYANYRLVAEFKWGTSTWGSRKEKARDSGIFIHMNPPDKIWPRGFELQIMEGATGDLLVVGGATLTVNGTTKGLKVERFDRPRRAPWRDELGFRNETDFEVEKDKWNAIEIICDRDTVQYVINGETSIEGRDANPNSGRIIIQSQGAEILFRRLDLYPLDH